MHAAPRARAAVSALALLLAAACGGSNGGGAAAKVGSGALGTPHPLTVQVVADPQRAVSAVIGPAGGEMSATVASGGQLTLDVPRGALLSTHSITLTPISSISGFPLRGGVLAGAQLSPDGLLLAKAATLNIKLGSPPGGGLKLYGFGYRHRGAELHLKPAAGSGASLSLSIWHFSGDGVGAGTSGDANAQGANTPTAPQDQVEQALALGLQAVVLLQGWDATLTTQIGQTPPDLNLLDAIYQQAFVFDALATLAGRPDLARDIYLKIGVVLETASQMALANCRSKPDAVEGLRVIGWLQWAQGHGEVLQHLDAASLEAGVVKCLRFKLDFLTKEEFEFGPEGIKLTVESKDIPIDAFSALPLQFASSAGGLKYDAYVWNVPGIPYTMSFTVDRPFAVKEVKMNLDLLDSPSPSAAVDGMSLTVDFGETTETAHIQGSGALPPLPFKSFYANGMENMHHNSEVGPHLFAISGWLAGAEPQFASLHETCPCQQLPTATAVLTESQDTTWVLRHVPQ